ncbi:hypothetical protein AGR7B_Lc50253 [Agrobacterium deltaense RV3]|nr:hypothetical protein AGR7B_Lc50253 [Agrobacterium deltaense RV3]
MSRYCHPRESRKLTRLDGLQPRNLHNKSPSPITNAQLMNSHENSFLCDYELTKMNKSKINKYNQSFNNLPGIQKAQLACQLQLLFP